MLESYQIPHVNKLINGLHTKVSMWDESKPGCGKTYTACYIAKELNLKLMIFCPTTLSCKWKEVAKLFNVEIIDVMTLDKLRGSTRNNVLKFNHKYLTHNFVGSSYDIDPSVKDLEYDIICTKHFETLINKGILIVVDESHSLKNSNTRQYKCVLSIVKLISKLLELSLNTDEVNSEEVIPSIRSRILFLSATSSDRIKSSVAYMRLFCIMKSDKLYETIDNSLLYRTSGRTIILTGYHEIIDKVKSLYSDDIEIRNILEIKPTSVKTIEKKTLSLYTLLKSHYISVIYQPNPKYKHFISNKFFSVTKEESTGIQSSIDGLIDSLTKDENVYKIKTSFTQLTEHLIKLQMSKVPIIVRKSKKILLNNPNMKIIIFGDYNKVLKLLCDGLQDYGVVLLNGKVNSKKRNEVISLFQQDDNICRVIVSNTKVGGVGIDLDDKIGTHPRCTLMIPSFNFIPTIQALRRGFRGEFTKSDVNSYFVYTKCKGIMSGTNLQEEYRIMMNLNRKMEILNMLSLEDKTDMLFTCNEVI